MKKTYCTRLNFPWNSEKRFFGRSSTSINFGASQSACDVMKLNTLELSFDVEQIYILNRCDWMKNEEIYCTRFDFPWNPEKHFFASASISINFGARQSARDVMTLSTSQILFDIEQVYILNPCDWMKVEENIYAVMFLKIMKKWRFLRKLQF